MKHLQLELPRADCRVGSGGTDGGSTAPMSFSVVVPLFNKGAFVRDAVESALAQAYPVHEVLVIDDGSTDGGAGALAGIRDPRLRIHRQENGGVSSARNRGIGMATGDWIVFLDADDWHHPELTRAFVAAHGGAPAADMLATGYRRVSVDAPPQTAEPLQRPYRVELIRDLFARWMSGPSFFTSSVAIRTASLARQQPCFAPGESHGEDLDLWFRMAETTPIAFVPAPLTVYRVQEDGLSSRGEQADVRPPYLARMRTRADRGDMPPGYGAAARRFVDQQMLTLARGALARGRRATAISLLLDAVGSMATPRWQLTAAMALFLPCRFAGPRRRPGA